MTAFVSFLAAAVLLAMQPRVCFTHDARNFDGYRYTEYCVGLFQRPETWVCVEVPR